MSSLEQSPLSWESLEPTLREEVSTTQEIRMDLARIRHEIQQEEEAMDETLLNARALRRLVVAFAEEFI